MPDAALALIARAAEGSMRDAQSALDQVIAFAGQTITVDDVSTVLGLVGRDLLLDLIEAVVDEDGPRAFALADRAVESGHDLRLVCRELSRVVRDMMLLSVDPARAGDGELAEGERERLTELARRFSREDLMRAFDLLSKAEQEIRTASHPRYYFEMVLLRWMHLRKLVPLADLLEQLGGGAARHRRRRRAEASHRRRSRVARDQPARDRTGRTEARRSHRPKPAGTGRRSSRTDAAPDRTDQRPHRTGHAARRCSRAALKDALLAEIRAGKPFFYNTVVAQAQKIEVADDRVTFTFLPTHRALREQFEQYARLARVDGRTRRRPPGHGRGRAGGGRRRRAPAARAAAAALAADGGAKRDLKAEAMTSSAVQAVLDVFPAEISDVEEMK